MMFYYELNRKQLYFAFTKKKLIYNKFFNSKCSQRSFVHSTKIVEHYRMLISSHKFPLIDFRSKRINNNSLQLLEIISFFDIIFYIALLKLLFICLYRHLVKTITFLMEVSLNIPFKYKF